MAPPSQEFKRLHREKREIDRVRLIATNKGRGSVVLRSEFSLSHSQKNDTRFLRSLSKGHSLASDVSGFRE